MREVLEHFLEWHALHFEDFTPEVNAELLCLANEAEAAMLDNEVLSDLLAAGQRP